MFTGIDMLTAVVLTGAFTAFICLFIARAILKENEKYAYMEGYLEGQIEKGGARNDNK